MTKEQQLSRAIEIATEAHRNQLDKNGQPYIGHLVRVMSMGRTLDEKICGVLHDLLEDTAWTAKKLQAEGFDKNIIEAVECLTKSPNGEYGPYIEGVKLNQLATLVKINDLTDNMDIRRLNQIHPEDAERLNRYLIVYRELAESLSVSVHFIEQVPENNTGGD